MGEQRNKKVSEEEALAEAEKTLKDLEVKQGDAKTQNVDKSQSDKQKVANAQNTEELQKGKKKEDKPSVSKKEGKAKVRSEKYKNSLGLVDRNKLYQIDEALDLLKKTSYSKFDGSVEVHIRLEKLKKGETVRGLMQLPHGAGKELKAAVIDEALIEKITKDKKTSYDILIATPEMMPKIAKIAKILGPIGKMPNPKSGTITTNPDKAIEEIKKGKTEYKADKQNIIHLVIGKISWDKNKLKENLTAIANILTGKKLQSITICATMGPGIKITYK